MLASAIFLMVAPTSLGEYKPPPGVYHTSWVGNSFGGDGGPNGSGYWVQDCAARIAVTPDGTVFCGGPWDEAGRCAGLYKDGKVNRALLKEHDGKGRETAWGWGAANKAVAAEGKFLYVANLGKKLLRFQWQPGDLDSARFVDEVDVKSEVAGLTARGDRIVVVYQNEVEVRRASDLSVGGGFKAPGARDAALDADGSLWILADDTVRRYSIEGKEQGPAVPGLEKPSAVAVGRRDGRLIVCEDGPRQQVLFYDVTAAPKRVATFGDEGGLYAGAPGQVAPAKLFSLRGADTAGRRGPLRETLSRFKGWTDDGKPDYDWKNYEHWPWPDDFQLVRRILYVPATDTLYLFGYLKDEKIESWGVVGRTARRYDGWVGGKPTVRWTAALPTNPKGTDDGKPLTPSGVALAGDYLFVGMVKPDEGKQYTHILGASDGKYVGSLAPGPEVGGAAGWEDMPYSVQALERKDGEYLILVEEDWRGKNLLYRWRPDGK